MTALALFLLLALLLSPSGGSAQEGPAPVPDSARSAGAAVTPQENELRVDVGGYGSFRYEAGGRTESSFTLRRFVVTTDARWGDRFKAYSEVEYERLSEVELEREAEAGSGGLTFEQALEGTNGSALALEQAWGELAFGAVGVRFGAVLPPVGRFNIAHDDNLWNFPRRPLADRAARVLPAAAAWTEMGIGLLGQHALGPDGALSWQAYFVNGAKLDFEFEEKVSTRSPSRDRLLVEAKVSPSQGAVDGSSEADGLTGRLAVSPALGTELAVSGYTGSYTPEYLKAAKARLSTVGVDGKTRLGPLALEGEYLHTTYAKLGAVAREFARVARDHSAETSRAEASRLETEVEIELTGVADHRRGLWLDASWPIALRTGALGFDAPVLAPIARYERVWLDGELTELDFTAGQVTGLEREDRAQERVAAGFAFRPLPQAVVQVVYEHNRAVKGALIDGVSDENPDARSTNGLVVGLAIGF